MNWITLSSGVYLFGEQSINRFEPRYDWENGVQVQVGSYLYCGTKLITIVDENVDFIKAALD